MHQVFPIGCSFLIPCFFLLLACGAQERPQPSTSASTSALDPATPCDVEQRNQPAFLIPPRGTTTLGIIGDPACPRDPAPCSTFRVVGHIPPGLRPFVVVSEGAFEARLRVLDAAERLLQDGSIEMRVGIGPQGRRASGVFRLWLVACEEPAGLRDQEILLELPRHHCRISEPRVVERLR